MPTRTTSRPKKARPPAGLREYRRKRNPEATPEPFAAAAADEAKGKRSFVVQKHDASHLHFDFRLELDGVLKSWAVPKGPSLTPGTPRLAVQVEDHPLEYAHFEGTIPKGQYGGGTVQIWDRGTWAPIGDPRTSLRKGTLSFHLDGSRLKGRWRLVRREDAMTSRANGRAGRASPKAQWLLIKSRDEFAASEDPVSAASTSVVSGRSMAEIGAGVRAKRSASADRPAAARGPMPPFVAPQLATAVSNPPTTDDWVHEVKLDGYRIVCVVQRGVPRSFTRNRLDWSKRFPGVLEAVRSLPVKNAIFDGEIVVFDREGKSDFQALQGWLKRGAKTTDQQPTYVLFDLMWLEGRDLRALPLVERKRLLASLLEGVDTSVLRYSDHIDSDGSSMLREACKLGLEGIIAKRADAPYRSSAEGRSRTWLKIKCVNDGEFAVCGMTEAQGSRTNFGALLLGRWVDGTLTYCGRVGTGFDAEELASIGRAILARRTKEPSCDRAPTVRGAVWCRPSLVAEVSYAGVTRDGRLRHPVFKTIRADKGITDLRKEETMTTKAASKVTRRRSSKDAESPVVAGITISHPDRVIYQSPSVRKLDLARYYEAVASHMLPWIAGRPLSLLRCPDGTTGECFFQKHFADSLPEGVRRVKSAKGDQLLTVDDITGLIALVQRGVIELHGWGSRVASLERPDYLVFDLDPGPGVAWASVRDGARLIRSVLNELELTSVLRTTGGKGLHVVALLNRSHAWPEAKTLAKRVAEAAAAHRPEAFTTNSLKERRKGRIYVDYLRNGRGATAIANYSARAREGAPVAMPIAWRSLARLTAPDRFTVSELTRRIPPLPDEWQEAMATIGR